MRGRRSSFLSLQRQLGETAILTTATEPDENLDDNQKRLINIRFFQNALINKSTYIQD